MLTPLPRHRLRRRVFRTHRHRPDAVCWCFFFVRENTCILLAHTLSLSFIPSLPSALSPSRPLSVSPAPPPARIPNSKERASESARQGCRARSRRTLVRLYAYAKRPTTVSKETYAYYRYGHTYPNNHSHESESKETYYSVKRDLLQCQKRLTTVSKETYYSVKRDLLQCQKRPMRTTVTGTHTRILCAAGANSPYIHTHTHTLTHSLTGHGYFVPLAVYLRDDHPESPPGHTHTHTHLATTANTHTLRNQSFDTDTDTDASHVAHTFGITSRGTHIWYHVTWHTHLASRCLSLFRWCLGIED